MPLPFVLHGSRTVLETRVFRVRLDRVENPRSGKVFDASVLESPDWVNIIPVTSDGDVVLIRQWRHGVRAVTLEIPGGMVDPGEDPLVAAVRELEEETGYRPQRVIRTGKVAPNPAIMDNTTHCYLATGVRPTGHWELDGGEDIDVVMEPLARVPELLRTGAITHCIVVAAFAHLAVMAGGRMGVLPSATH